VIFHQGSWLINGNDPPKDQFQASARIARAAALPI